MANREKPKYDVCCRGKGLTTADDTVIHFRNSLDGDVVITGHVLKNNGHDGKKLSKRHGALSVIPFHEEGYLREAVINYLVHLGWSHGDQEIFSIDEMIEKFDIKDINKFQYRKTVMAQPAVPDEPGSCGCRQATDFLHDRAWH